VLLVDLRMPRCDGVAVTARVHAEHPGTEVAVLTTYSDDESLLSALNTGARAFLTKDADAESIAWALRSAAQGMCPPCTRNCRSGWWPRPAAAGSRERRRSKG
jgi:DNA-binding NarL/FixJ family response regulator